MITIKKSRIYEINEIITFSAQKDIWCFLENKITIELSPHNTLNDQLFEWIEANCSGKVGYECNPQTLSLYFEYDYDLTLFTLTWQGYRK